MSRVESISLLVFLGGSGLFFFVCLLFVAKRIFAPQGVYNIALENLRTPEETESRAPSPQPLDERYRELIELGMIQLEPEEQIITGCGKKGETEEILLVTDRRAFVMTRREGSTFYAKQTFDLGTLRPLASSSGLTGGKIILSDGLKTAVIESPGDKGFLEDTRVVVREVNGRVRRPINHSDDS